MSRRPTIDSFRKAQFINPNRQTAILEPQTSNRNAKPNPQHSYQLLITNYYQLLKANIADNQ
jgi:hypothetical protein